VTTSQHSTIISIGNRLPISCGNFKTLLDIFGCLLAFFCWLVIWKTSAIYISVLGCAGITAIESFGLSTTTMNHNIFNLIIKLPFLKLWMSLQLVIWASLQLVTSSASCNISTTENDSLVNYWPQQLFLILIFTWKCRQLPEFTFKLAV
jgi:hypothetical protein